MLALLAACSGDRQPTGPGTTPPPAPPADTTFTVPALLREFRGIWIATVANLDWPSRTTLTAEQQRAELVALLDRAVEVGANAIVFQVRVNGERLYRGSDEPWATALAGGADVDPGYDPLQLAIDSARARGLEVHAWFNPFRAGNASDTARLAPTHFARRRADLRRVPRDRVTGGGVGLWFDPGEQDVQDHTLAQITGVVLRYDIDAVHLDDFFYPYPNGNGALVFPDDSTYARYQRGGGTLARDDWRRDNINRFVERMYREVKLRKPWMKVGISPFGIWRPSAPAGVTGLDAYAELYADSRLWLRNGWVDYLAPQLYWSLGSSGQPFAALLDWWRGENVMRRHVWPGIAAYRVADGTSSAYSVGEVTQQLLTVRGRGGTPGAILFRARSVFESRADLMGVLRGAGPWGTPAIPPESPWLPPSPTETPALQVTAFSQAEWEVSIVLASSTPRWWLVRWRTRAAGGAPAWHARLVDGTRRSWRVPVAVGGAPTDGIVVQSVDRAGNVGPPVTWRP